MPLPITIEVSEGIAIATVDSPPLNLMDAAMIDGLTAMLDELESSSARALLLRANGKVWTGGVDVELFAGRSAATGSELWNQLLDLTHRLEGLPFPTVFSAHGLCLTWGFELAVACDLLIAGERAKFGLVEAVVGLTPSMGGTQRLAARAGTARAKEFVMTGDVYAAKVLREWGVVNWVHPDDELEAAALALIRRLAAGPTVAHAATKKILAAHDSGGVQAADQLISTVCADLFETEDLQGAVRTFLDEGPGKATFSGR